VTTVAEPPSSEQNPDSAGLQQTGGVDINADQANIGGDVVGRDKVTQINTDGGAYVGRDVVVKGRGKFIGRDDNSVKRYFYMFRSVRQVVAVLLILIAVGAVIALGVWWTRQPRWMDGDFNIAVAQFDEVPTSDRPTIAPIISSGLFNYLDSTYKTGNLGFDIQVEHDKIDAIHSPAEAADVARRVNANLVIYGTVLVLGDGASVTPKFWVYDALKHDTTEMIGAGQHQLEYPFQFTGGEVLDIKSGVNTALQRRANILIKFTQALVYRKTNQYQAAHDAVQQAIGEAEAYGDFKGKETLYLIAADIARLNKDLLASRQLVSDSLKINPNYARAYVALANILYEQRDFAQAFDNYDRAMHISEQPYGAHIVEKANLGIGNIYSYQFQSQPANAALAELALHHFGIVVDAYQQSKDTSISELAALAYYGQGVIYQIQNKKDQARQVLEKVLSLSDDPAFRQKAQDRLNQL
jgi:tetratricopeptide (TPR) repeat protein